MAGFGATLRSIFIALLLFSVHGPLSVKETSAYESPADNLGQLIEKGREFSKQGRYEEALKSFEEAINLRPRSFESWMGKGSALMHMARFKEAEEAFDTSVQINPDSLEAWNNKGMMLIRLERYKSAAEAFRSALQINPESYETFINVAALYEEVDLATSWYNVSLSCAAMGKREDLFYCLRRAIASEPKYREEARKNPYFQAYSEEKKFKEIVGE